MTGRYEQILNYVVTIDVLFFGLTGASLLVFRARARRDGTEQTQGDLIRVPWHPITTGLFVLACWGVAISTLVRFPQNAGIGVAIRKGAAKPDLSTTDSFKQAMLSAKSIGFVDQTPTAAALKAIFVKLGIADEIKAKIKPLTIQAAVAVTNGDVEIAMTQISEILPYPGVELAGPLPPDIQTYTMFSAGISAAAKNGEAAAALIKFLTSPDAKAVIKAKGMEPG